MSPKNQKKTTDGPSRTSERTGSSAEPVRHTNILVIGGGLAGLAAAIRFRREGWNDFLVLERGDDVGGTWRDNTYPGAACDVPSHLYSYSFALNPDWSRSFSQQTEIQDYIARVARRYRVRDQHVFGCEVLSARWIEDAAKWEVETSKGMFTADILVGAFGALCEPSQPDIPGIGSFAGHLFHSARWDHKTDLTGKKVAVIGTGASGIQIVPAIAPKVAELEVYQRTAAWVLPRLDRPYSRIERLACKYVPFYQRFVRSAIYWAHEAQAVALTKNPVLMKPVGLFSRARLRRAVPDPALRRRLTPDYGVGCKRILLSNTYYPTFRQDHVRLVTEGISEVREKSIVTTDGAIHDIDAIVLATGFQVTDSPTYRRLFGKDGRSLGDVFDVVGRQCYKGTAIANFPNMFLLVGPNTGLGHNSMIFMIESQVNYLADAVATMKRRRIRSVEVRAAAQESFSQMLQNKLSRTIWNVGGCASWYLDKHGDNTTMWPGFSYEFRRITRTFDIDAYHVSTRGPE
ncbi:NAD(P)/FAD-dependent oxidoreductase [Streptomyces sp. NBC_00879]|uniref:flavin-containing monooxygenase n=1 Tax=Streptomyces sp. NBC_00879 TaxID=2975855 RepID=UPI00386CB088|nr:NAD(P)/FAD-dependent oxidoreductase [Streptomyces sp. NBC_00879]